MTECSEACKKYIYFSSLVYSLVVFNTFFKLLLFLQLSLRNLNFFTALRMYPKIISRIVFIIFSHLVVVIFSEIWRKYLIRYSFECMCVSWKHIHTSLLEATRTPNPVTGHCHSEIPAIMIHGRTVNALAKNCWSVETL